MAKLTLRQAAFVAEYLKDLNATQSAIRAGYSKKTADKQGTQLLGKPSIAQAIQKAMKNREARTQITQDRIVTELAKIAFSDGTDFAEVKHKLITNPDTGESANVPMVEFKDTINLPEVKKSAIAQIKYGRSGPEVIAYDKLKALELLGRHLGMFDKKDVAEEQVQDDGFMDALKGEAGSVWEK